MRNVIRFCSVLYPVLYPFNTDYDICNAANLDLYFFLRRGGGSYSVFCNEKREKDNIIN